MLQMWPSIVIRQSKSKDEGMISMLIKVFGLEVRVFKSYYGLGRYAKEVLIGCMGYWLRIELR